MSLRTRPRFQAFLGCRLAQLCRDTGFEFFLLPTHPSFGLLHDLPMRQLNLVRDEKSRSRIGRGIKHFSV